MILDEVRAQGWAIVDQQLEEGLCSVAAPIMDDERPSQRGAVCMRTRWSGGPPRLRTEFLPLVLETARRVSAVWTRR